MQEQVEAKMVRTYDVPPIDAGSPQIAGQVTICLGAATQETVMSPHGRPLSVLYPTFFGLEAQRTTSAVVMFLEAKRACSLQAYSVVEGR